MPPLEDEEEPTAPAVEWENPPPLDEAAPAAAAEAAAAPAPDMSASSESESRTNDGGKRKTRHQTPKRRRSAKKGRKGLSKKKTGSRK